MTRRLLLASLTLLLVLSSGCSLLSRNKSEKPPKESKVPAQDVAAGFKKRWLDKRVAELTAQGQSASVAQARAEQEFAANFEYLSPEKK